MANNQDCPFCEVSLTGVDTLFRQKFPGVNDRRFRQDQAFYTIESVAPVAAKHLLVCTHSHITATLPSMERDLLSYVTRNSDLFTSDGCFFEHGLLSSTRHACGISHAHVHFVTNDYSSVLERTLEYVDTSGSDLRSGDRPWDTHGRVSGSALEYIAIFDVKGRSSLLMPGQGQKIESQFMRKVIASLNGRPWNWREV